MLHIVIIEDETEALEMMLDLLRQDGFNAIGYSSAEEFFMAKDRPVRCLYLVDWKLPGIKGIDIVKSIREKDKTSFIFMLTGYSSQEQLTKALSCGVDEYISKPFDYEVLLAKIKRASFGPSLLAN
jgi:DNA-binding response OmpR family regulator